MFSLSCCAIALNIVSISSPAPVVLFRFSSSKRIAIFFSLSILTYFKVSNVFLANLDIDFVNIISIFPDIASAIILINSVLLKSNVPVIASSAYIPANCHSDLLFIFSS